MDWAWRRGWLRPILAALAMPTSGPSCYQTVSKASLWLATSLHPECEIHHKDNAVQASIGALEELVTWEFSLEEIKNRAWGQEVRLVAGSAPMCEACLKEQFVYSGVHGFSREAQQACCRWHNVSPVFRTSRVVIVFCCDVDVIKREDSGAAHLVIRGTINNAC